MRVAVTSWGVDSAQSHSSAGNSILAKRVRSARDSGCQTPIIPSAYPKEINMYFKSFIAALRRQKPLEDSRLVQKSQLSRCLSLVDLTALGIGSTLGLGIYVLAGQVAATKAGPSVVLSFAVAAIASIFAGLCYAEFGARVPKAGSAYVYSYITVGEFMAFIIGWNLVLEYLIGTASVARGYSAYLDSLVKESGWSFASCFRHYMPIDIPHLSAYPDFLSAALTILISVILCIGAKESTKFNSVFTLLNILVVIFVIICGSLKADFQNWNISLEQVQNWTRLQPDLTEDRGTGGFFPFGFSGMMAGAATCFFGFVGFDIIATSGEEARNPQKAIPIAISLSLFLVFLAYFGVSAVQTLMWPYYEQNVDAPLPLVFDKVGWKFAKWIVSIGALFGLSTSLLGAMFPLPRILYAMATDGLIFKNLATIHPKYKTPVIATMLSGFSAAFLSAIFDVNQLADMMSIGTLLAYSLVALSVIILRYTEITYINIDGPDGSGSGEDMDAQSFVSSLLNLRSTSGLDSETASASKILITASCILISALDLILVVFASDLAAMRLYAIVLASIVFLALAACITALKRQPQSTAGLSFKVPGVPFIPFLSIFVNLYLMMKLSVATWARFVVWMVMGFVIYFSYGIFKSTGAESSKDHERSEETA